MGYIFILRHGPTHHNLDKPLNKKKFLKIVNKIIRKIEKYGTIEKIYSSPISRCIDTAEIIAKNIGINDIKKTKNLKGCDPIKEKVKYTKKNSYEFGKYLRNKRGNILVVTHSSVLRDVLQGLSGDYIKHFEIEKASLTIYNTKEKRFIKFNIGWH